MNADPRLVWESFHGAGGHFTINAGDSFLEAEIVPASELAEHFRDTARPRLAECIGQVGMTGYITRLWVAQSHRSKGLGTRMMTMALEEFSRLGVHAALLRAIPPRRDDRGRLLRFYTRFGFEAPKACQDEGDPYVTMVLPLVEPPG